MQRTNKSEEIMDREMRIILTQLFLFIFLVGTRGEPCTEYGCPGQPQYESFVPAPPGHTPGCAKPGQTFCESLDHYPQQLIKFLIDKCSFDFSTTLRDEFYENFNAYSPSHDYHQGYKYPRQDASTSYLQSSPILPTHRPVNRQSTVIYGSSFNNTHHNGYKYVTPSRPERNPLLNAGSLSKYHPQRYSQLPVFSQTPSVKSFKEDQTWTSNGYIHSNKVTPQTFHENPFLKYLNLKIKRRKRQGDIDTVDICPTEAQYITPRAALNNQGNWMYVVNLLEQNDKYSQQVKSEKCLTTTCNGLCSVPLGYTTTCQQHFVQKRLIALEGTGDRLYTDVFWFPHGCSCQVKFNGE